VRLQYIYKLNKAKTEPSPDMIPYAMVSEKTCSVHVLFTAVADRRGVGDADADTDAIDDGDTDGATDPATVGAREVVVTATAFVGHVVTGGHVGHEVTGGNVVHGGHDGGAVAPC
jgi:hypothetical protein